MAWGSACPTTAGSHWGLWDSGLVWPMARGVHSSASPSPVCPPCGGPGALPEQRVSLALSGPWGLVPAAAARHWLWVGQGPAKPPQGLKGGGATWRHHPSAVPVVPPRIRQGDRDSPAVPHLLSQCSLQSSLGWRSEHPPASFRLAEAASLEKKALRTRQGPPCRMTQPQPLQLTSPLTTPIGFLLFHS